MLNLASSRAVSLSNSYTRLLFGLAFANSTGCSFCMHHFHHQRMDDLLLQVQHVEQLQSSVWTHGVLAPAVNFDISCKTSGSNNPLSMPDSNKATSPYE